MRKLNSKSRVFLMGTMLTILSMSLASCIWFLRVDCPEEVETDSTFEVRLVIDDHYPDHDGHNHYNCWGYLGVQLPVGWTIDADELEYEYFPKQDRTESDGHTDTGYHTAGMEYDEGYVKFCCEPEYTDEGYYWTGFSTLQKKSECMDSIVVKVKIHTDGQLGDKALVFTLQENGDADIEDAGVIGEKPNYPFDKDPFRPKPAARKEGDDNGAGATHYAEITVKQKSGVEGVTINKEASYNVSPLGNGQLQVNLADSKTVGATAMVYDMKGQIVATQTLTQAQNVLSATLPQGVYSVAVQKDGVRSIKKAIVK